MGGFGSVTKQIPLFHRMWTYDTPSPVALYLQKIKTSWINFIISTSVQFWELKRINVASEKKEITVRFNQPEFCSPEYTVTKFWGRLSLKARYYLQISNQTFSVTATF